MTLDEQIEYISRTAEYYKKSIRLNTNVELELMYSSILASLEELRRIKDSTLGMVDNGKFECPSCGGYKWGTANLDKPQNEWIGRCHGGDHFLGCGFEWNRNDDDKKYFHEL